MSSGSRERYLLAGGIFAMIGVIAFAMVRFRRRRVDRSFRAEQRTREGAPIADEWGKESFPASDPPQSW